MSHCHRRTSCRLCDSQAVELAFSLTPTPPANEFVTKNALSEPQEVYPLDLFFCMACQHLQLLDVVSSEVLFRDYVYVSGTSKVFVDHFRQFAKVISEKINLSSSSFVFEIGSNDGTLLKAFQEKGMKVLGVDPAKNIAQSATESGIPTMPDFFSSKLAAEIAIQHGKADLICANNVFAHIDDLSDIAKGVQLLLKDEGVFTFEVSYLVDVIEKNLFDTIYHEHLCYHSVAPLTLFFERLGMELFDAERISTHGGSLRCFVRNRPTGQVSPAIKSLIAYEREIGLGDLNTFRRYAAKIEALKVKLVETLQKLKSEGRTIAGFGAPAKATTLMYHFKLNSSLIDYIVDDSPLKQGLFSPGLHIPVLATKHIYDEPVDYLLVLAWNFADSIVSKHSDFLQQGGHFIVPIPEVRII